MYTGLCIYVNIHIYIYIEREREKERERESERERAREGGREGDVFVNECGNRRTHFA